MRRLAGALAEGWGEERFHLSQANSYRESDLQTCRPADLQLRASREGLTRVSGCMLWKRVQGEHETSEGYEGYVVHAPDDDCRQSVSRAHSKAIGALAAEGIVLVDDATWPQAHPAVHPYKNREGAQVAVSANVDRGSVENDVLACHPVLLRLAGNSAFVKGGHLSNVHVRFPNATACCWKPPHLGWHVERGAGSGLSCTCILHLTHVHAGGGGVAVVVGSHRFVQSIFLCGWIPSRVKEVFWFHVLLGYLVSWAARCGAWEIREVAASKGGVVQMNPYLVHAPSHALSGHKARLSCQIKAFSKVPSSACE